MKIALEVNGAQHEVEASPWKRLLDVLREDLRLTGTKEGCGEGECGACTVMLDGEAVNSCLVAAGQCHQRSVTTVEGLADGEVLHAVQKALVACGGAQCGICTPGIAVCAAHVVDRGLVAGRDDQAARAQVRELLVRQHLPLHGLPADRRRGDRRGARGRSQAMTAYLRPRDLDEAVTARAAHPAWMVLAGGTDLMVNAPHRPTPAGILDLWRLGELGFIRIEGDAIAIGAGTTWHEVERHPAIRDQLRPLALAAREIGALQIQARGTLGGNVGTSSPVGDSLPVLLALDATIEVASVRGRRRVAYATWCTGYRTTQLAPDELIVAAHVPLPGATTRTTWRKVGTRRAQSISKVMGAAAIILDGAGGDTVVSARVALGAVADRPIRVPAVEAAVQGLPLAQAAEAARMAVRQAIQPIDDLRSTAIYRREVAENLVARFFSVS